MSELFLVACFKHNLDVVECIVSKCPLAAAHNLFGNPALVEVLFRPNFSDNVAFGVLKMLLEQQENVLRDMRSDDGRGLSLLHIAAMFKNYLPRSRTRIYRILIRSFPSLLFERCSDGYQPLHVACHEVLNLEIIKVILEECPDAIHGNASNGTGSPIFHVSRELNHPRAVDVIRYLLGVNSSVAGVTCNGMSPLLCACFNANSNAGLEVVQLLYNAYPQALIKKELFFRAYIEEGNIFVDAVANFLLNQLRFFTLTTHNVELLATPDDSGNLPIHSALQHSGDVSFGTIKVMAEANPATLQVCNGNGSLSLHIACASHGCPKVVKYLLDHDRMSLFVANNVGDTPLHCACRAANHDIISILFTQCPNAAVNATNSMGELPIHLLSDNSDHDSAGYVSSIFLLLNSNPEPWTSGSIRAAILYGES